MELPSNAYSNSLRLRLVVWLGKFSLDPVVESRMQGFWHFGQKCLTDICLLGES